MNLKERNKALIEENVRLKFLLEKALRQLIEYEEERLRNL